MTCPVYYDVEEGQFHWLDYTVKDHSYPLGRGLRNTENPAMMSHILKEIWSAQNTNVPSMLELLEMYGKYNGEQTTDITEADTVFSYQNIDREQLGIKEEARVISSFELDLISKEFSGNSDLSKVEQEPVKEVEKKEVNMAEHPLVKQLSYLRDKITKFPFGVQFNYAYEEPNLDRE